MHYLSRSMQKAQIRAQKSYISMNSTSGLDGPFETKGNSRVPFAICSMSPSGLSASDCRAERDPGRHLAGRVRLLAPGILGSCSAHTSLV